MKKIKVFLLRRWYMVGGAALVLAAAIFYVVNYPVSVSAAASTRQLPIYSVERTQKVCAISFDAAWGDVKVRQERPVPSFPGSVPAAALPLSADQRNCG